MPNDQYINQRLGLIVEFHYSSSPQSIHPCSGFQHYSSEANFIESFTCEYASVNGYTIWVRDIKTGDIICRRTPGGEDDINWDPERKTRNKLTGEIKKMIKVGIRRLGGKLTLLVNARDFHTELDKIGVTHDGVRYNDRPSCSYSVASNSFTMSPEVLLRRDYKDVEVTEAGRDDKDNPVTVKKMVPVTASYDLSGVWTTPPSFEQLKKLCNSANDVARKILEHYQPIDISVEIHKKVVK